MRIELYAQARRTMLFLALVLLLPMFLGKAWAAPPIPNGEIDALYAAIENAKQAATIKLAENGYYLLDGEAIEIDKKVTIQGRGATIDGNGMSGVFSVTSNGDLTLNDLTVTGGFALAGAGIRNGGGEVTLKHCSVNDNRATSHGGGIFNAFGGTLKLYGSSVDHNTAENTSGPFNGDGGGIFNHDQSSPGGTAVILNDSSVSRNTAAGKGGGIYNNSLGAGYPAIVILSGNSNVNRNEANSDGGGIYNIGITTLSGNSGVYGNTSLAGGGIYSHGTLNYDVNGDNVNYNRPNDIGP